MTYFPDPHPTYRTEEVLTIGQASAGTYIYEAFVIDGDVQIVALYAELTSALDTTELSDLAWDIGKHADTGGGTWLTAGAGPTGADMSGFVKYSWIGKCDVAANVADVLDASAFGLEEKPLESCIVVAKGSEATVKSIGFQVTEDNDTDAEFTMVCLWKKLSSKASVTPGGGAIRAFA